jgi:hypothetical protein
MICLVFFSCTGFELLSVTENLDIPLELRNWRSCSLLSTDGVPRKVCRVFEYILQRDAFQRQPIVERTFLAIAAYIFQLACISCFLFTSLPSVCTAMELGMAPAAVLSEHTAKLIAYTQASDVDALRQAGVRIKGVEELAELLTDFKSQLEVEDTPLRGKRPLSRQMVLPIGPWTSTKRWPLAVYKPGRGGTPAAWEPSHTRFAAGEHPQTIAMNQDSGKPVQVATENFNAMHHSHCSMYVFCNSETIVSCHSRCDCCRWPLLSATSCKASY